MSSRALRKAQREKEEQDRLDRVQQSDENDNEPEPIQHVVPKQSAFAMLEEEQDEADEQEEQEEHEEQTDELRDLETERSEPRPKSSTKKKKKKNKAKSKGTSNLETPASDTQLDEIDTALKQLSTQNHTADAGSTAAGADIEKEQANKLLAIDSSHLHAQNEMRRLFGRAAFEEQDDDQPAPGAVGGNRRQQRRAQQVGLAQALRGQRQGGRPGAFSAIALRRNIFVQGKEEWPAATTGGLGMEIEEKCADGTVIYRFVHNTAYQDVQAQFENCVESMDPNRLVVLLQHNPYHISTLLQVSEIAKQERDHATSGDLLERALFSFGRAVHSTFAKNLSEGKARLDFRRAENRELWLASWRYMQNLSMRATWRTVYEWAKLLLSLSPENDPYGIWLILDQHALRSRQELDFLNLSRSAYFRATHENMPNIRLSQGLAEVRAGNSNKGKQALFTAMGKYPWIVARLLQELNLDAPPAVWGKEPRTEKEKLYCELYVHRAKDLWNIPEVSSLLVEIASAIPPETKSTPPDTTDITQTEARHVILSDDPSLIALIPRQYTTQLTSTADPIPPDDAFMSYLQRRDGHQNPAQALSVEDSLSELQGLQRFFAQMFPWYGRAPPGGTGEARSEDDDPDTNNGEEHGVHMDAEEMERRIQASGISQEEIVQRARRMTQIERNLLNQLGGSDLGEIGSVVENEADADGPGENDLAESDHGTGRHARVEDAPDE